ncbi:MAG: tetratricopeptide repeat protein [Desulfosalsimonadaceae bacterium]
MDITFFKAAFSALVSAATTPLALAGYIAVIISYTVIGLKAKRNKQLLDRIEHFPNEDRRKIVEQEMGSMPIPEKFTAEQWLKARTIHYKHIGFWVIAGVIILLAVIASWTYMETQRIKDQKTAAAVDESEKRVKKHISKEMGLLLDQLKNPPKEQVLCELDRQFKGAKNQAVEAYEDGNKAYENNFFDRAIEHFKKALEIVKIPSFYLALGNSYYATSHYEDALKNYQAALSLHRKDTDCKTPESRQGEASALSNIGLIYSDKGDLDNALKYHQDALVIDKEIGHKRGEADDLCNLGLIYSNKGDLDNALKYFQDALMISKEIGFKEGGANALGNIGLIYLNVK